MDYQLRINRLQVILLIEGNPGERWASAGRSRSSACLAGCGDTATKIRPLSELKPTENPKQ
jgi:hypothetical protein